MSLIKENGLIIISDDNYFNTDEDAYGEGHVTREILLSGVYEKSLEESSKLLSELISKYGNKAVLNIVVMPGFSDFDGFGGDYIPHLQIIRPATENEIKEFKEYMKTHSPETVKRARIKQLEEELKRLKEEVVDEDGVGEHALTKIVEATVLKIPLEDQPIMLLSSETIIKKEVPPTLEEKMEFSKKLSSAFDMTTVYAEQQKKLEAEKAKRTAK